MEPRLKTAIFAEHRLGIVLKNAKTVYVDIMALLSKYSQFLHCP